ncbi:MAG: AEC family transporter [bacterium]
MGCCYEIILSIFLIAGISYLLKSLGFWGAREGVVFSRTVLYVTLPCFILLALAGAKLTKDALIIPIVFFLASLICGLIGFFLSRFLHLPPSSTGTFILSTSIANTGFLGYPVIQGLYGAKGLAWAAIIDQFGMALPLNTLGIAIASHYGENEESQNRFLTLLKSPPFIACIVALFLIGRPIPSFLHPLWRSMELLRDATVPLIMLFLGISLRPSNLSNRWLPLSLACLIKLFLQPLLVYSLALSLGLSHLSLRVSVLQACMPTALMTVVFSEQFKLDLELASGVVFLTTLLSIFTIPFMSQVLSLR